MTKQIAAKRGILEILFLFFSAYVLYGFGNRKRLSFQEFDLQLFVVVVMIVAVSTWLFFKIRNRNDHAYQTTALLKTYFLNVLILTPIAVLIYLSYTFLRNGFVWKFEYQLLYKDIPVFVGLLSIWTMYVALLEKGENNVVEERASLLQVKLLRTAETKVLDHDTITGIVIRDSIVRVFCRDGNSYAVSNALGELEQQMRSDQFFRINRNTIIAMKNVSSMAKHAERQLIVTLTYPFSEETEVVVSKQKTPVFRKWMQSLS